MKSYLTSIEGISMAIKPSDEPSKYNQTIRPYLPYFTQKEFCKFLQDLKFEETGNITPLENEFILKAKEGINKITKENNSVSQERLEFDYAIEIHKNLRKLNWGRYLLDDLGMWRYLSLNYFKEEVFSRRAKQFFAKGDHLRAAKLTFDHAIGLRSRDIFPRRYFIIGERLFDKQEGYKLLEELSILAKASSGGGFGNLIANLIETSLLSPNDYVSKTMSKVLFLAGHSANDKEVAKAFVRYNGFKSRLLNNAHETIYRNEICLINP